MKHGGGFMMVCAAISWYSILLVPLLPFMVKLLQGQVRYSGASHDSDVILKNIALFQDNSVPIHTGGTVQSWSEEYECEL
jgi:hypothetical protein